MINICIIYIIIYVCVSAIYIVYSYIYIDICIYQYIYIIDILTMYTHHLR